MPGENCWPSEAVWNDFSSSIGGRLIKSVPVAASCYEGPLKDEKQCAHVNSMWPQQEFQTGQPLGRWYPFNMTCPPVGAGQGAASCTLGQLPAYAVQVTERRDISETLEFARRHNVRVAVVNTGHDLNGRADGYGSLAIWMHHFRNAVGFEDRFESATGCERSGWDGHAMHIDGGWQWRDVHKVAEAHGVLVVGAGSSSLGATGGWLSGGGHGPASRNYGLGADQLLEAEVMLANGTVVTANHCQHPRLFRALRGGGPGYGIVLGTKVKAYPNVKVVTSHRLAISPVEKTANNSHLLDAVAVMLQSHPDLNEAGYAGYGFWFRELPVQFIGNATSGYTHSLWTIGKGRAEAEAAFAPVRERLAGFEGKLVVNESFAEYGDYWSFYRAEADRADTPGDTLLLTSRMMERRSVQDYAGVRRAVEAMSGKPEEHAMNLVMLVSGGRVSEDDASSGLNPAWRTAPMVLTTGRRVARTATAAERKAVADDVTFVKGAAARELAPGTGGYMNEGDGNDPDYVEAFYGDAYDGHLEAKRTYDPERVFYCPTCVGADEFVDRPDGALCRV